MKKRTWGWYPINFLGGLMLSLYSLTPIYLVYVDSLGFLTLPARTFALSGMVGMTWLLHSARKQGYKIFSRKKINQVGGFTLIELLVVISLIGIMSTIIFPIIGSARESAYFARSKAELRQMNIALEMYASDHAGNYPPDAARTIPPGIEAYVTGKNWPAAPWPGSVFDWDAWAPSDLTYEPKEQIYQISIRFCPVDAPAQCKFPQQSWAQNFDYYSAAYLCIRGPCRAHSTKPLNHPAYCINC